MEITQQAMVQTVSVAVAQATVYYDKLYTYALPNVMQGRIFVGSIVLVPFGVGRTRPRIGLVLEISQEQASPKNLKAVLDVAPKEDALNEEILAIVRYMREVTMCTWFDAVGAVLPYGAQYRAVQKEDGWKLHKKMQVATCAVYSVAENVATEIGEKAPPSKLTEKQRKVYEYVCKSPCEMVEICRECGVGESVVKTLCKNGILTKQLRQCVPDGLGDAQRDAQVQTLNQSQAHVAAELEREMRSESPKPTLLYGVTGSGKTAVFLHLIRNVLKEGKAALVLVPEIGLTPQMLGQLRAAFGGVVAVQHSALSQGERLAQWYAIKRQSVRVVVGTRSAVFAPLQNIGLIVVDEEQEHTYQSESSPRYDARDIARRRAKRHGAMLLLASATPSVSSYYMAQTERYGLQCLGERFGDIPLPEVEMVDMRNELLQGNPGVMSSRLAQQIENTVNAGEQAIVMLNKRGYQRVALCEECGEAVQCTECSVPMILHRSKDRAAQNSPINADALTHQSDIQQDISAQERAYAELWQMPKNSRLICHYCGKKKEPAPQCCPKCGGKLQYSGFGTQRLEDEIQARLPSVRVQRMDLDTTQNKGAHQKLLAQFAQGQYDVLLGTQMIAKGLDFERVSLVGVVGIDSLLYGQGYRTFEQVFSLVTQVVGRAGRSRRQGKALIQTMNPHNAVLQAAARQDYDAFYEEEIAFRKLSLYPPFCSMCMVGFVSKSEADALMASRRFAAMLSQKAGENAKMPLRILGPVPMQVAQVAGSFRYRLTLKCRADAAFRALLRQTLHDYAQEKWPQKVSVYFDFHGDN